MSASTLLANASRLILRWNAFSLAIETDDVGDVVADVDADRRYGWRCVLYLGFHGLAEALTVR